jgi:hypothetical protein
MVFVLLAQVPIIIVYYILKKHLPPSWLIQAVNGAFLVVLLVLAF